MSQPTNSLGLGSSPLGADHPDDGGSPLFVATPRRAMGSTLVAVVGAERMLRIVLDELGALTGRTIDPSVTFIELVEVARSVEVDLSGLFETVEHQLAAEAGQRCPCGHRYHAFDVCGSCSCVDGPAFDAAVAR